MSREFVIRRLRQGFVLGLGFITLVVVATQATIARAPAENEIAVHVMNLAGRQRTLCQQIAKASFMLHEGAVTPDSTARAELDAVIGDFARSHHALRHGDPRRGLPAPSDARVIDAFEAIDPWFRDVVAAGEALVDEPAGSSRALRLLAVLHSAERSFLPRMETIVEAYEAQTARRVEHFRDLESLLLAGTIIALLAVGMGVIRPVIRNVELEIERRRIAEDGLRIQADELRKTARAAEAAAHAKARFLASMSHEMRTPLNGIVGMAQVLETSELSEEQHADLGVIHSSSQALLALISDILDLAKVDEGQMEFESVPFDLHELVERQAMPIVAPAAARKRLATRVEIAASAPRHVAGDPTRLRQVLLNLLSNAVKFTESGHVTLRVGSKEGAGPTASLLCFEVIDTGMGIDPSQKAKLFQPFTQVDQSTTRRFGGTGLGLAISYSLVAGMSGELDFDSVPGEGSTFRFELELEHAPEPAATTAEPLIVAPAAEARPLDVLLVDDLRVNRLVARKLLAKMGHRVDEAEDGIEAVEAVEARRYDLILMDLEMPRLDGIGATARIRALDGDRARTPIVALTANALAGDRERTLAAGLDDYLAKPISRERLSEVLHRFGSAAPVPSA